MPFKGMMDVMRKNENPVVRVAAIPVNGRGNQLAIAMAHNRQGLYFCSDGQLLHNAPENNANRKDGTLHGLDNGKQRGDFEKQAILADMNKGPAKNGTSPKGEQTGYFENQAFDEGRKIEPPKTEEKKNSAPPETFLG